MTDQEPSRLYPGSSDCSLVALSEMSADWATLRDRVDELEEEHGGGVRVDVRIEVFDCDC